MRLVIASYYGYAMTSYVAGRQAISEWKCIFFRLFSIIEVNPMDDMMQSAKLCDILDVKHEKLSFTRF